MTVQSPPTAGWPQGSLDLLARAALAPEPAALEAWQAWRRDHDIDTTPWGEVRMLGSLAKRIEWLEPDASIRPRIHGIRKFLWVQSQICLKQIGDGLRTLNDAQVPVMLLKGAARIATDPAALQERLIRDVDALVPVHLAEEGYDALIKAGWAMTDEDWQPDLRAQHPVAAHHAWALRKGSSELDLHHFSNTLNRLVGDDDGLWSRALPINWRGVDVLIPSPADALLIALTHGARWSVDKAADWTVDACAIIDEGAVDWAVFVTSAHARMLQAILLPGLRYLHHVLARPVPQDVFVALEAELTVSHNVELASYASRAMPQHPEDINQMGQMSVRRALRQEDKAPISTNRGKPDVLTGTSLSNLTKDKGSAVVSINLVAHTGEWIHFIINIYAPDHQAGDTLNALIRLPGQYLFVLNRPVREHPNAKPSASFALALPKALFVRRQASFLLIQCLSQSFDALFEGVIIKVQQRTMNEA